MVDDIDSPLNLLPASTRAVIPIRLSRFPYAGRIKHITNLSGKRIG
jgi:hypothetical protein